jgi:hypothetical protein
LSLSKIRPSLVVYGGNPAPLIRIADWLLSFAFSFVLEFGIRVCRISSVTVCFRAMFGAASFSARIRGCILLGFKIYCNSSHFLKKSRQKITFLHGYNGQIVRSGQAPN